MDSRLCGNENFGGNCGFFARISIITQIVHKRLSIIIRGTMNWSCTLCMRMIEVDTEKVMNIRRIRL